MDIPKWTGKLPQCLNPKQKTTGDRGKLGAGDEVFL